MLNPHKEVYVVDRVLWYAAQQYPKPMLRSETLRVVLKRELRSFFKRSDLSMAVTTSAPSEMKMGVCLSTLLRSNFMFWVRYNNSTLVCTEDIKTKSGPSPRAQPKDKDPFL